MRLLSPLILIACALLNAEGAQLELVAGAQPESVFSGAHRTVPLVFRNDGSRSFDHEIRARVFQTETSVALLLRQVSWKKLQVLPGQTVLESAQLDFPVVAAETKFLIQWLDETNHVI